MNTRTTTHAHGSDVTLAIRGYAVMTLQASYWYRQAYQRTDDPNARPRTLTRDEEVALSRAYWYDRRAWEFMSSLSHAIDQKDASELYTKLYGDWRDSGFDMKLFHELVETYGLQSEVSDAMLSDSPDISLPSDHPEAWGRTEELDMCPTISQVENSLVDYHHMQYRGERVLDITEVSTVYRVTTESGSYYARDTTRLAVHPDSVNHVFACFNFPTIVPGKVVKLDDGRVGIVDCIQQSPIIVNGKPEKIDRAYIIGASNEFADWVVLNQIAHVYGEAVKAACTATFTA